MTSKVNTGKFSYQYGYDLRNRLASANITRKEGLQDVTISSNYTYNTAGIRTRAEQTINGITQNRYFLLDSGHTGYAQVFEETSTLGGNLVRSYVLGDDVLSQNVGGVNSHLLYDGHGSTRQLAGDDGAVSANYAYDAYGKMLGGNPGVTDGKQSATDLLYAGEQFDPGLQMEYLRARYYDQDNGRFNRLDPFDGNSEDPQSLHKYAYAHADPVNGIDPSGEMGLLINILYTSFITASISGLIGGSLSAMTGGRFSTGFINSFFATFVMTMLILYAVPPPIAGMVSGLVGQLAEELFLWQFHPQESFANLKNPEIVLFVRFFMGALLGAATGVVGQWLSGKAYVAAQDKNYRSIYYLLEHNFFVQYTGKVGEGMSTIVIYNIACSLVEGALGFFEPFKRFMQKTKAGNYGVGERALSEEEGLDVTEDFLKQQGL